VLNLVDNYVGGFPLIIVGVGELIAVNWVYGFKQFNRDIQMMLGRKVPMYFQIMWIFGSPILMLVSFESSPHSIVRNLSCRAFLFLSLSTRLHL